MLDFAAKPWIAKEKRTMPDRPGQFMEVNGRLKYIEEIRFKINGVVQFQLMHS